MSARAAWMVGATRSDGGVRHLKADELEKGGTRHASRSPRPSFSASLLCVLAAVALSSCGGRPAATVKASRPTPQRFVAAMCKTVLAWKDLLDIRSSSFVSEVSSVQSPPGSQILATYLSNVARDADAMLAQVEAAGTPALASGSDLRAALVHLLAGIRSTLAQVKADETKLLPRGPAAFVGPIEASARSNVKAIRSTLRDSSSAEVTQTIVTDRNCKDLFEKPPVDLGA